MLRVVRDEVFPHFRKLNGGTTFGEYMQDAQLMIQKDNLLVQAVNMVDALPITEGDAKGDLYEYLLSKLTTAGINGQFRTPRYIIRFMVELLEPTPPEYREKARVHIRDQGGPSWAHPAIAGGRLYLRKHGTLTAHDIRAR